MDTLTFLKTVLPEDGVYIVANIALGSGSCVHHTFDSIEEMANAVETLDADGQSNVYHACSAYVEHSYADAKGKIRKRTLENVRAAKSFWLDLDVGESTADHKKYESKKDAANALTEFCRESGLSMPMIVSSGHGLHCYWVMQEEIEKPEWRAIAKNLDAVLKHRGMLFDHSATHDMVRVLRPANTHNRKKGKPTKGVNVVRPSKTLPVQWFVDQIDRNLNELEVVSPNEVADINRDLFAHTEYSGVSIPSSGAKIATLCPQISVLDSTQGDVPYETWRAGIGLAKHCTEGKEIVEHWTERRHENHDKTDYDREWDSWEAGPPTCKHFEQHNPSGCQGCPHKGEIKSPIVLGHQEIDMSERTNDEGEVEVEVPFDSGTTSVTLPPFPPGYDWRDGVMVHCAPVPEEEKIQITPFASVLFYATYLICNQDGTSSMQVRVHLPREGAREFLVPTGLLNAQFAELGKLLGANRILKTEHKRSGEKMTSYLSAWYKKLQNETNERMSYAQFGWDKSTSAFTVGNRSYQPDGAVTEIIPGPSIEDLVPTFEEPTGDVQTWKSVINAIFNRPNERHRQYAIGNAFGCTLSALCSDPMYRGVVFAITGGETAKGKTTTALAAMSAFGDPFKMMIGGQQGATENARYGMMGLFNNLPLLIDDITHMEPDKISAYCYDTSMGSGRRRMKNTPGGVVMAESATWAMSPFVTANTDLHGLLAGYTSNTTAEAVRMIEIYIDEYEFTDAQMEEMNRRLTTLSENQGVAGDIFLRYVTSHRKEVAAIMDGWASRLGRVIKDSKYRHYRSHAECTLSALEICYQLGILDFDVEEVYKYTMQLFSRLAEDILDNHSLSHEDALGQMLTDLAPHIVVTGLYKDARHAEPDKVFPRNGKIRGRVITGESGSSEALSGRLYLSRNSVKEWCGANRLNINNIIAEIRRLGLWVELEEARFVLGRGTTNTGGQERCICMDYDKMTSLYESQLESFVRSQADDLIKGSASGAKKDEPEQKSEQKSEKKSPEGED